MPVKIRCRGCEKVLNAPDKARGRVIRCPNCSTKLKVPGGDAKAARPARAKQKPADEDDFLAGLDFSRAESEEEKVCPFCAAEMDPDDVVCRACGMNVERGVMDRREKKRRARRGPDPARFYKAAWVDSWQFLRTHWRLAVRTGVYWALFAVLLNMCSFMVIFSRTGPPKFFWGCMTFLSMMGFAGWYWFLALKIIESTMHRDQKMLEYINFDIFQTITIGLRAIFWPYVIALPLLIPFNAVAQTLGAFSSIASVGLIAGLGLILIIPLVAIMMFSLFAYPLALVHMTQRYTYKAWILWEMLIVSVKNFLPTLYFWIVALVVLLPVVLMTFVPMILLLGLDSGGNLFFSTRVVGISQADIMAYNYEVTRAEQEALEQERDPPDPPERTYREIDGWTERAIAWCFELVGERPEAGGWVFILVAVGVNMALAFLVYFPVYMIIAFPAVFMMRVNGLLGYYNRETLGLVNQIPENKPANFWVRFLAEMIDQLLWPLAVFLVFKDKRATLVGWGLVLVLFLLWYWVPLVFLMMLPLALLYYHWLYYATSEASATRTTIGKDAFGLIVNDLDNRQITLGKASMRWFGRILCGLTLNLGYLLAAFHPEKRGLHDLVAGTRCCWKGDR
jgi:uncharacterized RDD family membrane protein YckC